MTMYKLTCAITINTISPPTIKHWLHCIQPIYEIILFKRGVYSYSCELITFCLSYSYVYQPPPQLNAIIWTLLSFQRNLKTLSYKIKKKKKNEISNHKSHMAMPLRNVTNYACSIESSFYAGFAYARLTSWCIHLDADVCKYARTIKNYTFLLQLAT